MSSSPLPARYRPLFRPAAGILSLIALDSFDDARCFCLADPMHIEPAPTPYAELNGVLVELTSRAAEILGDSFVGAYLQGSFALGDADPHSDCDFLIPTRARSPRAPG
jgi:hypothetical protein